ncbi:MAG: NB-ARC domain-containing protein [Cyanobacteria bacterium P01_D01_bin.56]
MTFVMELAANCQLKSIHSPSSSYMATEQLFEQASAQWNLDPLYAELAKAKAVLMPHKQVGLTAVEKLRLRGLLLGYSPAEIAEQQYTAARTVEVALSQGLYRYVEQLTGRDRNALESWRDVADWLEAAGYRSTQVAINWDQMPDVPALYGRKVEIDQLKQWMLGNSACRFVSIIGPAGMGKTSLAITLAKAVQNQFDGVIWQSLRHQPALENVLGNWLGKLPNDVVAPSDEWYDRLSALMTYLQTHRCLVVIDNLESILSSGSLVSQYDPSHSNYREMLKRLGEQPHQSCIVVTSRERNQELSGSKAANSPIRYLELGGLQSEDAVQILEAERLPTATKSYWKPLITQYRGNPLMLRIVAMTIQDLFDGDVRRFLGQKRTVVGNIEYLIDQQYERLSVAEQEILGFLAEKAEPIPIEAIDHPRCLEAISALLRRSLIEKSAAGFTLIPVVMEYVRHHVP